METLERISAHHLRAAVVSYLEALRAHRERLNRLNVYPVPDADTGTNMALTVESVVVELDASKDMASTCAAIGRGALMGARGISGVLLCQILRTLAERFSHLEEVDGAALAGGMAAAADAAYAAVSQPVEGTILTVARAAADAALGAGSSGRSLMGILEEARAAAESAESATPELLPALREAGVVDAGGAGFVLLLDALLHVTAGRPLPEPPGVPQPALATTRLGGTDEGDRRYEVACRLEAPDEVIPALREAWSRVGSAVVAAGGDGTWTCHLHTDTPGAALDVARGFGRLRDVRVTDLALQVAEERETEELEYRPGEEVSTAVVAVGTGDGVRSLFRSLGAHVVTGTRSLNPSVGELVEAVESAPPGDVLVLPNDERVVPAARQVAALTGKQVTVVPTRSMAEGLAALQAYDPQASADRNAIRMAEAARAVRSGFLVRAVRDATGAGRPIRKGEWLAMTSEGVVAAGPDIGEVAAGLFDRLVEEWAQIVTIIEGEGSSEAVTDRIVLSLQALRPDVGVQVLRGGQPLRPYVFGVA